MNLKSWFYRLIFFGTSLLMLFCLGKVEALSLQIPGTYLIPTALFVIVYFKYSFFKKAFDRYGGKIFWLLLMIGIISRAYWNIFSGAIQTSDAAWYLEQAVNISQGKFFLHVGKQTGASILSALAIFLTPFPTQRAALLPLLLVSSLFPFIVFLFLKKTTNRFAALIGMTVAVFWPEAFFYSNFITASVFQSFFILLGYNFWLNNFKTSEASNFNSWTWSLLCGASIGVAQYMRPNSLIFLIGTLLIVGLDKVTRRSLLPMCIGFVICCLPIIFFNWNEYKIISLSPSQNSGNSMVIGTHFESKGHYYENFNQDIDQELNLLISQNELPNSTDMLTRSKAASSLAKKRILSNPLGFVDLAINYKWPVYWANAASLAWTFDGTQFQSQTELTEKASFYTERYHRIMIVLIALSLMIVFFRAETSFFIKTAPFLVGCIAIASVHLIAEIQSQYHVSTSGFFPICSALGFAYLNRLELRNKIFKLFRYAI